MKKVVVTGGAGFIGSHLVEKLLGSGHSVLVLDSFVTGHPENLKKHKNLKVVEVDVCDFEKISKYFVNIDWVFHLAALADIVPSVSDPLKYLRNNIDATISVLEASRQSKVKKFVYSASSSCYGIAEQYPTPETAKINPEYPYALSKYMGEELVLHYGKVYNLPVISLRLFNVYGPRARSSGTYGAVFGVFLSQKLSGKPYTVVGDGEQTRDFTFVTDVANAFFLAAESKKSGRIFNVGSGGAYSINEIVKLLGGSVTYIPKRPGEPDCTYADITKIKKELNWKPEVSLEKGVNILLENIDLWKNAPVWTPESIKRVTKDWFESLKK